MQNNVDRDRRRNFSPQVFTRRAHSGSACINPRPAPTHHAVGSYYPAKQKLDRRTHRDRPDDDEFDFRQIASRPAGENVVANRRCRRRCRLGSLCRRRDRFPVVTKAVRTRAASESWIRESVCLCYEILPFANERDDEKLRNIYS